MTDMLHFEFVRNALMAGLLVSIACGLIGTLVVINRIVFIAGGIAHAAFGGIGLSVYLGYSPEIGALIYSLISSIIMGFVTLFDKHRADTVIGVFWAFGMAIGIIASDLTPGYNSDLMGFLFGNIIAVSKTDLFYMLISLFIIFATIMLFYKQLFSISFDRDFSISQGLNVSFIYILMIVIITLGIMMTIKAVGLILVIALITIPVHIAEYFSSSLLRMMFYSSLLSLLFIMSGLIIAFKFNISAGATIILTASLFYMLFSLLKRLIKVYN